MRAKSLNALARENPGRWVFCFGMSSPRPNKEGFAMIHEGALGNVSEREAGVMWNEIRAIIEKYGKAKLNSGQAHIGEVPIKKT